MRRRTFLIKEQICILAKEIYKFKKLLKEIQNNCPHIFHFFKLKKRKIAICIKCDMRRKLSKNKSLS